MSGLGVDLGGGDLGERGSWFVVWNYNIYKQFKCIWTVYLLTMYSNESWNQFRSFYILARNLYRLIASDLLLFRGRILFRASSIPSRALPISTVQIK